MLFRLSLACALLTLSNGYTLEQEASLEVMGITPGETTIDQVKSIVSASVKKVKCKEHSGADLLECRTKGEQKSFTLAGQRVSLVFEAPFGASGNDTIKKATFDFREKGPYPKNEDARLLIKAFTAKFGTPTNTMNCEINDTRTTLDDPARARRTCATWRDSYGHELSVIYRIRQDAIQALGGSEPDHFIQVEILDGASLIEPLIDDL